VKFEILGSYGHRFLVILARIPRWIEVEIKICFIEAKTLLERDVFAT